MSDRLSYRSESPEIFRKFLEFSGRIAHGAILPPLLDLVFLRASQLNGCAFCLDMHSKQATIHGERPLRLYTLAAWRETTLFTPRERAALAWTEAVTELPPHGISDEAYASAREQLSEKELSDLTYAVTAINAWNRLNIAFRPAPGTLDKEFGLDKANLA